MGNVIKIIGAKHGSYPGYNITSGLVANNKLLFGDNNFKFVSENKTITVDSETINYEDDYIILNKYTIEGTLFYLRTKMNLIFPDDNSKGIFLTFNINRVKNTSSSGVVMYVQPEASDLIGFNFDDYNKPASCKDLYDTVNGYNDGIENAYILLKQRIGSKYYYNSNKLKVMSNYLHGFNGNYGSGVITDYSIDITYNFNGLVEVT